MTGYRSSLNRRNSASESGEPQILVSDFDVHSSTAMVLISPIILMTDGESNVIQLDSDSDS